MKFKEYAKSYFTSCGVLSVFLVSVELIFHKFENYFTFALVECYIYLLIFLALAAFLEMKHMSKKTNFIITNAVTFIVLGLGNIILDIIGNEDINIFRAILLSVSAVVIGTVAGMVIKAISKLRNKHMNRKLKEYQDSHTD